MDRVAGMDRRELLHSVGGLLAIALGAGVAEPALAGTPGVGAWLAEQDRRSSALGQLALPAQVRDYLRSRRLRPELLSDAFSALAGVTAYRELPAELQDEPPVQARLRRDGEALGRAVLDVTAYLEALGPNERDASARTLRESPELAGLFHDGIRAEGQARGVDTARLDKLSRAVERVTWRLSRQDPDRLIDDCIDTVDRLAGRTGLVRSGAAVAESDWSPVGRDDVPNATAKTRQEREERRIAGDLIKHVGQLVCLFGLLIGGVSVGAAFVFGASIYILGVTGAALVLVAGLMLIIIGSYMNNP